MSTMLRGVLGLGMLVVATSVARGQEASICGLQRAEVLETRDPAGRDRLFISLPARGPQSIWAERLYVKKPLRAPAAAAGDPVFVLFEGCDPARPVVIGFARP